MDKVEHTTLSLASSIVSQGLQFYVPESSTTVVVVRREKLSVPQRKWELEKGSVNGLQYRITRASILDT